MILGNLLCHRQSDAAATLKKTRAAVEHSIAFSDARSMIRDCDSDVNRPSKYINAKWFSWRSELQSILNNGIKHANEGLSVPFDFIWSVFIGGKCNAFAGWQNAKLSNPIIQKLGDF